MSRHKIKLHTCLINIKKIFVLKIFYLSFKILFQYVAETVTVKNGLKAVATRLDSFIYTP